VIDFLHAPDGSPGSGGGVCGGLSGGRQAGMLCRYGAIQAGHAATRVRKEHVGAFVPLADCWGSGRGIVPRNAWWRQHQAQGLKRCSRSSESIFAEAYIGMRSPARCAGLAEFTPARG